MEMNPQIAKQQLEMINQVKTETKRIVTAKVTCKYLILWGLAWSFAYVLTQLYLIKKPLCFFELLSKAGNQNVMWIIWGSLMAITGIIQGTMTKRDLKSGAVRPIQPSKASKQMFWFWLLLFGYSFIALTILSPKSGIQTNAFLALTIMFAYIMMGIWCGEKLMIWLGIIITINTLIGYFIIPANYYSLWMAVMAGGVMLGAGVFGKIFWALKS